MLHAKDAAIGPVVADEGDEERADHPGEPDGAEVPEHGVDRVQAGDLGDAGAGCELQADREQDERGELCGALVDVVTGDEPLEGPCSLIRPRRHAQRSQRRDLSHVIATRRRDDRAT
jgi:hypothetical protein